MALVKFQSIAGAKKLGNIRGLLVRLVIESENGARVLRGDGVIHIFAGGGASTSRVARAESMSVRYQGVVVCYEVY